jgi:hypothetical protein
MWTSLFFVQPVAEILKVFGSGIFITTLVSSILNFHFQKDIHSNFSIIRGAEGAEVKSIYENRSSAMLEINNEFQKARSNDIDLISVSGTDFFQPNCPILRELNRMSSNNSNVNVRILLLDPRSKHAIDRSLLEEGVDLSKTEVNSIDYPNKKLCQDTLLTLRQLEWVLEDKIEKNSANFKIEVRTYDTAPILLLAHVNNRVFVEQYHYGIPEDERKSNFTKCLGKRVPLLEFSAASSPGLLWLSHFNYLWETSREQKVSPGYSNFLRKALLEKKCWLNVYEQIKNISKNCLVAYSGYYSDDDGQKKPNKSLE